MLVKSRNRMCVLNTFYGCVHYLAQRAISIANDFTSSRFGTSKGRSSPDPVAVDALLAGLVPA